MTEIYDPLFNKKSEASYNTLAKSPISGKPLRKIIVGMHDGESITALVNQEDRVVFPLIEK